VYDITVRFCENELEQNVLSWLNGLGCAVLAGPDIAPGELLAERRSSAKSC
jgi:hypothetical protein